MAEIVNLRRMRKRRERDEAGQEAAANRARFGRTLAERDAQALEADKARRTLDGARLEARPGNGQEDAQRAAGNPAENGAKDRATTS